MTVEQQSGWAILIVSLVVVLIASLALVVWDVSIDGAKAALFHIPRFALIIGLYVWLLRGGAAARWILVALLVFGGGAGLYGAFSGAARPILSAILGLLYLAPAALIATSSSVNAFLAHQQARAQRSSA